MAAGEYHREELPPWKESPWLPFPSWTCSWSSSSPTCGRARSGLANCSWNTPMIGCCGSRGGCCGAIRRCGGGRRPTMCDKTRWSGSTGLWPTWSSNRPGTFSTSPGHKSAASSSTSSGTTSGRRAWRPTITPTTGRPTPPAARSTAMVSPRTSRPGASFTRHAAVCRTRSGRWSRCSTTRGYHSRQQQNCWAFPCER